MNITTARLRVKAKKFKASIPLNMGLTLPDKLIDSISDDDIREFLEILKSIGLRQAGNYWEKVQPKEELIMPKHKTEYALEIDQDTSELIEDVEADYMIEFASRDELIERVGTIIADYLAKHKPVLIKIFREGK